MDSTKEGKCRNESRKSVLMLQNPFWAINLSSLILTNHLNLTVMKHIIYFRYLSTRSVFYLSQPPDNHRNTKKIPCWASRPSTCLSTPVPSQFLQPTPCLVPQNIHYITIYTIYRIYGLGNRLAEAHSCCRQIHLAPLRNPFPTSFVQHPLVLPQRDLGSNSSASIGMHCGKDHWGSVFWRTHA